MIYCNGDIEKLIRTQNFSYLDALPPIERFTEKFRLELEEIPLHLKETDEIFGWYGYTEQLPDMELPVFSDSVRSEEEQKIMYIQAESGSTTYVDKSHVCADYARILRDGLIGYERLIELELYLEPDSAYLQGMKRTIASVRAFTKRMEVIAEDAATRADGEQKARFLRIKEAVAKVPYYPAETFLEAVQAIWIIHFLIPLAENGWCSVSLGPFDQYMYPYYCKALEQGMTIAEIKKILHNFYELLNSYSDGACLLNVGGPECNELSYLLVQCQKEFAMPAPILGARISSDTPKKMWEALIDEKLFVMGQPTFYSEAGCVQALVEKGVPEERAKAFTNNSCMAIGLAGEEVNSMWGCVFCVSSSLEAALNRGKIINADALQIVPDIGEVTNAEELFDAFEKCAGFWLDRCVSSYENKVKWYARLEPDVFLSVITDDSIALHKDRLIAAKYHNITFECMGMINVADGICAIDKLVFHQKKYSLGELIDAVRTDFETSPEILEDMLKCPKFGKDTEAEEYAIRVAQILQRLIRSHDHDNFYYSPSLHTLDSNVKYGSRWGAGFDGRRAYAPFAKNGGPTNLARGSDPTSVVLAAARLPQYKFYGGQPIDVHFQVDAVNNHKMQIAALIKTYFSCGGLQFQVNALSSATLRDAVENPERYEHLVVRIGGYSCYFNSLTNASKVEFIERFEIEEG